MRADRRRGPFARISCPEGAAEQLAATVEEALPVFQASGDDFGLFTAYLGRAQVAHMHARMDGVLEAVDRAFAHAQRVVDHPHLTERLRDLG